MPDSHARTSKAAELNSQVTEFAEQTLPVSVPESTTKRTQPIVRNSSGAKPRARTALDKKPTTRKLKRGMVLGQKHYKQSFVPRLSHRVKSLEAAKRLNPPIPSISERRALAAKALKNSFGACKRRPVRQVTEESEQAQSLASS